MLAGSDDVGSEYLEALCGTLKELVEIKNMEEDHSDIEAFTSAIPAAIDDLVRTGLRMWMTANNLDREISFL